MSEPHLRFGCAAGSVTSAEYVRATGHVVALPWPEPIPETDDIATLYAAAEAALSTESDLDEGSAEALAFLRAALA